MGDSATPQTPILLRWFALAVDPIHVGTGGYRLGRVDMSIVREPGTNLPKVPGTSIAGACRTYAAMALASENQERYGEKFPHCAGQGLEKREYAYRGHCGDPECPICVSFGFARGEGGSFQGLAQFSDARLLLFPVRSLAGPVWITCPSVLRENGTVEEEIRDGRVRIASSLGVKGRLNLGWLLLDVEEKAVVLNGKLAALPNEIRSRVALVSDRMFCCIVNDNLEVRTSVAIDPGTGAAASGLLYTYEAIPRASVLWFDVVISDPKYYRIVRVQTGKNGERRTKAYVPVNGDVKTVEGTVRRGLELFSLLGIGGMSTRGMGRMQVFFAPNEEGPS